MVYLEAAHYVLRGKVVGDRVELKLRPSFVLPDVGTQSVILRRNIRRPKETLCRILTETRCAAMGIYYSEMLSTSH